MNRSAHILEDNGIIKQSHYTINGQYAFPISPGGKVYEPKSQTEVPPYCYWKLGHIVLCYQIRNLRKPFVYTTWVTQFPNLLLMSPHWIPGHILYLSPPNYVCFLVNKGKGTFY